MALSLAEGKSLREIAREHGVSINTVRSQIRLVMERTGAHRQTELVRIIGALPRLKYSIMAAHLRIPRLTNGPAA